MPATARTGDIGVGICCCHPPIPCIGMSGIVISGATTSIVEGSPPARCADLVLGGCGHVGVIISCSSTKVSEGLGTARSGDGFSGCFSGVIVTGAATDISGG